MKEQRMTRGFGGGRSNGARAVGDGESVGGRRSRQRLLRAAAALGVAGVAGIGLASTAVAATPGPLPQAGAPGLPNGRALEMVSPPEKNGVDVAQPVLFSNGKTQVGSTGFQVRPDGSGALFVAAGGFAGATSIGSFGYTSYKAVRGTDGWQTTSVTPRAVGSPAAALGTGEVMAATADLSDTVLVSNQPLAEGTHTGQANVFVRKGGVDTLLTPNLGVMAEMYGPIFAPSALVPLVRGVSDDLSQGVFVARDALLPGDPVDGNGNLYAWNNGVLRLVAPDADAGMGAAGPTSGNMNGLPNQRSISADGRRIAYSAPLTNIPQVYVTADGGAPVQASASQGGSSGDHDRMAAYQAMSADGSKVFFTSAASLTPDANTYSSGAYGTSPTEGDLYMFDVGTGQLKNLTPQSLAGDQAPAVRRVVGVSDDGKSVYVSTRRRLNDASQSNDGPDNLYLLRGGEAHYIAKYTGAYVAAVGPSPEDVQVTPDGQTLAFSSRAPVLADYDNDGKDVIYKYSAADDVVSCVSCRPDGSKPSFAANLAAPYASTLSLGNPAPFRSRTMSADGRRVFFYTRDAVLPGASNGQSNVYMLEDGKLSMISSGRDRGHAFLFGTTPSGDDVFFSSRARLVPADVDESIDVYTARVGGGFAEPDPGAAPCTGDACQGRQSDPPTLLGSGSTGEAGGNLPPEKEEKAAPKASLKVGALSSSVRRRLASGSRVQLPIKLVGGGKVSVRATASIGGHQRTVATATRTVRQTGPVTVNLAVRLSSTARKQLAQGKRLRIRFRAASSQVTRSVTRTETIVRSAARNGRGA